MRHNKLYRYFLSVIVVLGLWQSSELRADLRFFKINPNRYSPKDFNTDFDAEWQTGLPIIVHYNKRCSPAKQCLSVFAYHDCYSIPPKDCPPEIIQAIQNGKCTNVRYYIAFTQAQDQVCNLFPHLVFLPRMERSTVALNNVSMGVYGAVNLGEVNGEGRLPLGGVANFPISYHDWNMLSGNISRFQIADSKNLAEGWFLMRQGAVAVVVHWYFFPPQGSKHMRQTRALAGLRTIYAPSPISNAEPQIMPLSFGENTLRYLNLNTPWAELPIHAQQSIRTELMAWLEGNFIDSLGEAGFLDRLQEAFPVPFITWIQNNLDILPNLLRFYVPKKILSSFLLRLPNSDNDLTLTRELCCIFPERFVQFLLNHRQDIRLYANLDFQMDIASVAEFLGRKDFDILKMNEVKLCSILSSKNKFPKQIQTWLAHNTELLSGWHLNPQPTQRSAAKPQRMTVPTQPSILTPTDFLTLLKQFSILDMDLVASREDPLIAQDVLLSLKFPGTFIQWVLDCPNIPDLYYITREVLHNNPDISGDDLLELLPVFAESLREEHDQACVDWLVKKASSLMK